MKKILLSMVVCLIMTTNAKAEVGFNIGLGIPFVNQYGVNLTMGPKWSADVSYNKLNLSTGISSVKLTMPALMLNFHPMSGAFFIGLGVGQETLVTEAREDGVSLKGELSTMTTIAKLGWMWGKANGGFWFGMDLAFISPSGDEGDITVSGGVADAEDLEDVQDALDQFGSTSYTNITFAKFGWLF